MADLGKLNFNPENVEDLGDGFTLLAPGIYSVVITDSKVIPTKNNDGHRLVLTYQIIEGNNTGITFEDGLNIVNPSVKCQNIGLSQLKNICDAIGHTGNLDNSEQLHGKPFSVQVVIVPGTKINPKTNKPYENNDVKKRMKRQESQQAALEEVPAQITDTASNPW